MEFLIPSLKRLQRKAARYEIHRGDLQKDSKFAKASQALAKVPLRRLDFSMLPFKGFSMVPFKGSMVPVRRLDFSLSDRMLAKFGPKQKIQLMQS